MKNIFITYNKSSEVEENTALRMQTLSSLYGLTVNLPFRLQSQDISSETKKRITNSRFVLAFSIDDFTDTLRQDLDFALTENKPIIVIYDTNKGRNINFPNNANVEEVFIDYYNTDDALHQISKFLKARFVELDKNQKKNENALGIALVAVGLGLLASWALAEKYD